MAEYNWWDDRTVAENDGQYCPLICSYCYNDDDCDFCEHHMDFVRELRRTYNECAGKGLEERSDSR